MSLRLHVDGVSEDPELFAQHCARSAAALAELGVGAGDIVALMLYNEPELIELKLAVRQIGAHFCLLNWHFKSEEAGHILRDSGAKVFIVHANLLAAIRDAIPESLPVFVVQARSHTVRALGIVDSGLPEAGRFPFWPSHRDARDRPTPPDVAPGTMMAYTSGTSGRPKGIVRSAASMEQIQAIREIAWIVFGFESGMRILVSAPLYHSAPSSYVVQAALHDADLWIEPRFDAERTLAIIDAERITHLYLVPTMYRRLLRLEAEVRVRYDLSSVRYVASTGSPCPSDLKEQMVHWFGPVIHEAYAASELGYITHIDSHESLRKPGSAGRALPGTTLKILSESGDELPCGEVGLIYARNRGMPDFTYRGNDMARRRLERDGLWTLGDMGYLDEDGYLFVVDRNSDMVISGGVNIYPAEIEAVLATMPGVSDVAVFGIPDEEFGESLLAAIELRDGCAGDAKAVQDFVRQRMAGYKVPRQVIFHAQLPREDTGKIFKRKLRDPFWVDAKRRV